LCSAVLGSIDISGVLARVQFCIQCPIGFEECTPIYRSLISLSLLLTLLTVVLSAYIRLAEVGIGCEDWPACYAQLDPGTEKKGITVLTSEGSDMAHYGARVAHRYIASTLGLFIFVIFLVALRQGGKRSTSLLVPLTIFAITVFLSLLGYYTPTRSNPMITMGNLLGGMALLGLLWWLLQREADSETVSADTSGLRPLALLTLGLVALQIVLGGWSSANYASGSCPGLARCEGKVLEPGNLEDAFNPMRRIELDQEGQVIRPDSLALLSMSHRVFALLTAAYLAWLVRKLRSHPALVGTAIALSVFSIGQLVLGVSTVWFEVPLLLLSLHNCLAALLLLGSVNLLHRLVPHPESQPAGSAPPR
jgi:cytochrome c oxidase assembly protein subunit 15